MDEDEWQTRWDEVRDVLRRVLTPAQFEAQIEALETLAACMAGEFRSAEIACESGGMCADPADGISKSYLDA